MILEFFFLCVDYKKKLVWRDYLRRKKRWIKSLDMSFCFRFSFFLCCFCDCEKFFFFFGISKINKEIFRYNSNIFRVFIKCYVYIICGVFVGGL